jgi:hypothetical protein
MLGLDVIKKLRALDRMNDAFFAWLSKQSPVEPLGSSGVYVAS